MAVGATGSVFSIPYRYLWSTNFAGDLEGINERPTGLARFVGDEKNRLLKILSDGSAHHLNSVDHTHLWPLVLFGPAGTGKTSLALTIVSELADRDRLRNEQHAPGEIDGVRLPKKRSKNPPQPVVLTAVDFDRRFRSALATDSVADFRRRLLQCSGLVIDDLQQIADKPAAQNELLQILDQMLVRRRPMIVTVDCDPQLCSGLMPQLISRFCGGLSLPVQQPGRLARETIIRDLVQINSLKLSEDAVGLLVEKLVVTVPRIVHFFGQLKTASRLEQKNDSLATEPFLIDAVFISRMFLRSDEDVLKLAKLITLRVAAEFKLKPKDLRSDSRKQSIVLARAVAVYLIRKLLGTSFLKIGSLFGNRDHSTIMHANQKIEVVLEKAVDKTKVNAAALATKQRIDKLIQQLTNQIASQIEVA